MQIFKPLPKPNLRGQLPFEALVQKDYRWEIAKTDNGVRAREFASLEKFQPPSQRAPDKVLRRVQEVALRTTLNPETWTSPRRVRPLST